MIVRNSNWEQRAWLDLSFPHDGFHRPASESQDGHIRLVNNRSEMSTANATLVRDRESATLQFLQADLAVTRFLSQIVYLFRQIENALLIHIAQNRDDQSLLGINGKTDVIVLLEHDLIRSFIKAGVEDRMLFERLDH